MSWWTEYLIGRFFASWSLPSCFAWDLRVLTDSFISLIQTQNMLGSTTSCNYSSCQGWNSYFKEEALINLFSGLVSIWHCPCSTMALKEIDCIHTLILREVFGQTSMPIIDSRSHWYRTSQIFETLEVYLLEASRHLAILEQPYLSHFVPKIAQSGVAIHASLNFPQFD